MSVAQEAIVEDNSFILRPEDLYTYEFRDDKHLKKFINKCKRIVRASPEYSEWVSYIKFTKNFDQCQFTHENIGEVTVDIHHHPYSMESLVIIAVTTMMEKYQMVNSLDVAKEVLKMHFSDSVGYVLLISSLHEKFHNGFLKIPIDIVNGNWKEIDKNYTVPEEIKELVNKYRMVRISDDTRLKWDDDFIIYDDGMT